MLVASKMNELEWSVISLCILYFQLKEVYLLYTAKKKYFTLESFY